MGEGRLSVTKVLDSVHHANRLWSQTKVGEGRLSVKAGRKGARASSCFDRKPNAFYTYSFQITAPTSEVPNTVMDKHTD